MSVKEWPAPKTLTFSPASAAALTIRTVAASLAGRSMATGLHDWLPPQFRHASLAVLAPGVEVSVFGRSTVVAISPTSQVNVPGLQHIIAPDQVHPLVVGHRGVHVCRLDHHQVSHLNRFGGAERDVLIADEPDLVAALHL